MGPGGMGPLHPTRVAARTNAAARRILPRQYHGSVVVRTVSWYCKAIESGLTLPANTSLLFDFFVTSQRIRRVLSDAMAPSGMKPDEYAVYSLLFEKAPLTATEMADFLGMPLTTVLDYLKAMSAAGHLQRIPHPLDGRAVQLRLNTRGVVAHRRAHDRFEVVYQD